MKMAQEPHNLLILSKDHEEYRRLITQADLPGLTIMATSQEIDAILVGRDSDMAFGEPSRLARVIAHLPGLRWVQATYAGIEPFLAPGLRHDFLLTNARNVYGSLMSEYVFGYLLMVERQAIQRFQAQSNRKWDDRTPGSLRGKLLGLLGVGSIGAHLAGTAKHFMMRVYGYTRQSEACPNVDRYFHGDDWPGFAHDLDFLVCTLPGTSQTRGMVNAAFLSALPRKTWLVNIGRGTTFDEPALAEALANQSISGAILDVFATEPLPPTHPLWTTPNTFITSHTAARNYLPDIAALFIDNYQRYITGQPLLHQVSYELEY